ncbi:SWF/SNF helicase family protein, partial [bacterium]|nr:SWF/SNF helicase family protein [bacterium]
SLYKLMLVKDKNDPKTDCLVRNLKSQLKKDPGRKIVIFSEYVDTVNYLKPILEKAFPDRVLSVTGSLATSKVKEINKNFDASYPEKEDRYDILLSSDKLSEGFNLNRAGMVINYDIPWNPVRVIQRVGRINRISKKVFDELYIVNFFPTEKGAELVKSREIASNKMFLIHNTLGEDARIFDIDEQPTPAKLYERIQQNPERMEEESFYTKALNEFFKIKETNPDLISSLDKFPLRVKVARRSDSDKLLVFIKKNRLYIQAAKYTAESKPEIYGTTFEEVFERIACTPEEKRLELSEKFWEVYEKIKTFKSFKSSPLAEQSLERKAINNLKTFIYHISHEEVFKVKRFLKALLDDITDYGTLSDYTLRRIANLESQDDKRLKKSLKEIYALKEELGEDYLEREKIRQRDLTKEIIVAIEHQK